MTIRHISFAERQARSFPCVSSPPSAGSRRGFTLVELLVVIAIILCLGALISPVISKIRHSASSTKCASNLKQIGAAVLLYAGDNDGALPGPLWSGQTATCTTSAASNLLMYFLAPYLGPYASPAAPYLASPGQWYSSIFECPSARSVILVQNKSLDGAIYFLAPGYLPSTGPALVVRPFGYPPVPPAGLTQPMRLVSLAGMQNVVALTDLDQKNYGVKPTVAAEPVHGSYRNTLYFDGHVQPVANH
jgi:prepilin-type N-terminal cleavage/methylation domain-containing protein/prepilin-type processing-associated H-X9-DG protein